MSVLPLSFKLPSVVMKSLVFGESNFNSFTMTRLPSRNRSEIAEHIARLRIFFGKLYDQSRGCCPCTLPPPFHNGESTLATPAAPLRFCRQGLRPAPDTSP